jgi:hypothetical protein
VHTWSGRDGIVRMVVKSTGGCTDDTMDDD